MRDRGKGVSASRKFASALLWGFVILGACLGPEQPNLAQEATMPTTQSLLEKAHGFEVRGRMDLAAQTWEQILLTDRKNTQALGGLVRAAKLEGDQVKAEKYLDWLRAVNPNDPEIAAAQKVQPQVERSSLLRQAARYARAGQYDQAMEIYRKVYGSEPPEGDAALAFYETEAATANGRTLAAAGLRRLVAAYPNDFRYAVALGRVLTYDPATRPEGRRLLARYPDDAQAAEALRQSLLWDAANPATAGEIRAYLLHHSDTQLSEALRVVPAAGKSAMRPVPLARAETVEQRAGYVALSTGNLDVAEREFEAALRRKPGDAGALAGMGYLRMQQANFGGALSFLLHARQAGSKDPGLDAAVATSRFWLTMAEGAEAVRRNDLAEAEKQYRLARGMRPQSAEALEGLGGTLLKAQQFAAAADVFEALTRAAPSNARGWRGLLQAQYGEENAAAALDTERRMPALVRGTLMQDPLYLRALAATFMLAGREPEARRVLEAALDLPFPADARNLELETKLEFAALLEEANRTEQARGLYRQVVGTDARNIDAWKGLVRTQLAVDEAKASHEAAAVLGRMTPAVFTRAMDDTGFEQTVAAVYANEKEFDRSQDLLVKVIGQQSSGRGRAIAARMQLAGLYVRRGNPSQAYELYRQILTEFPDRDDAMSGLLGTLHAAGRDEQAANEIQVLTPEMRTRMEREMAYLQTAASIYTELHRPRQAEAYLARLRQIYVIEQKQPPADVVIESAWLLYNSMDDAGLYRQLMMLGERSGLSEAQRQTTQTIWIDWAVRRANQAAAAGQRDRAVAILDATASTFPGSPGLNRALAGGYARAGETKRAETLWLSEDLTNAPAGDFRSAVGAAMAAGDEKQTEHWLRAGLEKYPRDAQLLLLAARQEQNRGEVGKAISYYRASLDAMPPELPMREPNGGTARTTEQQLPREGDARSLIDLLRPEGSEVRFSGENPSLPGYGTPLSEPAVPAYMRNPAVPRYSVPGARPNLRDYVPQASAGERVPRDGTEMPGFRPVSGWMRGASLTPAMYQLKQVAARTEQILTADTLQTQAAVRRGRLSDQPSEGAVATEVYGPYVPYVPPPAPDATMLKPGKADASTAVTKLLQRRQATVISAVPTAESRGQSSPPPDDYGLDLEQAAEPAAVPVNPERQVPHPFQSPQKELHGGQQYPQPETNGRSRTSRGQQRVARRAVPAKATTEEKQLHEEPGTGVPSLSASGMDARGPLESLGPLPVVSEFAGRSSLPLPLSDRQQAELELNSLEGSYSGWLGANGSGRYRSGQIGLDRLADTETSLEASAMLGNRARLTVIPTAVFLNPGTVDPAVYAGTGTVLGTLRLESSPAPSTQSVSGIGGELQLATRRVDAAVGYTPYEFLVRNVTGRVAYRATRHLTFYGDRSVLTETALSYEGQRDPGTATPTYSGNIWGGVVSTGGGIRIDAGTGRVGFYAVGNGSALTGYHVLRNTKFEGLLGAYFLAHRWQSYGRLTVGASLFGEHYANNEIGLSYGQGGYFSPDAYFQAAIPVAFEGHNRSNFHYRITSTLGVQTFEEANALFYPLDPVLQRTYASSAIAAACALGGVATRTAACNQYASGSNTGVNYGVEGEAAYLVARHWYFGGFVTANNTNNYNTVTGGFYVRYTFRPQFSVDDYPTGLYRVDGVRPLRVP